ncbi:MAG: tol-pal system protein YbgF [Succinivibrio sp.]|nr:tol-pal system protein YbgF [Succinivibrio sp.]
MKKKLICLALCSVLFINVASADDIQSQLDAQQRTMLTLQNSISSLQNEIQSLNGQLEELRHELSTVKTDNAALKELMTKNEDIAEKKESGAEVRSQNGKTDGTDAQTSAKGENDPSDSGQKTDEKLKEVTPDAKSEYEKAYSLVEKNDLSGAAKAFADYVVKYPDSKMTPNAWYWLGQIQYKLKDYDAARASFLNSASYKDSPKRPDSLYKLGLITLAKGDKDKARRYFEKVIKTYPQDTSANMAKKQLEKNK